MTALEKPSSAIFKTCNIDEKRLDRPKYCDPKMLMIIVREANWNIRVIAKSIYDHMIFLFVLFNLVVAKFGSPFIHP